MIVIDASAILEILGATETGLRLKRVIEDSDLHAPHLIDLEIASAIRRWERARLVTSSGAAGLLEDFLDMPLTRHPHEELLQNIWELRHDLTPYDAAYLALSRALGGELITMDEGLRKRAKRR
jgi:predicted nucleic acid-binding protein